MNYRSEQLYHCLLIICMEEQNSNKPNHSVGPQTHTHNGGLRGPHDGWQWYVHATKNDANESWCCGVGDTQQTHSPGGCNSAAGWIAKAEQSDNIINSFLVNCSCCPGFWGLSHRPCHRPFPPGGRAAVSPFYCRVECSRLETKLMLFCFLTHTRGNVCTNGWWDGRAGAPYAYTVVGRSGCA